MKPLMITTLAFALGAAAVMPAARAAHADNSLPAALQPAFYAALADDARDTHALDAQGCTTLAAQSLQGCFTDTGARFKRAGAEIVDLRLAGWSRGTMHHHAPAAVAPRLVANGAHYEYGPITEWWKVLPLGFEQGFTFDERPAGTGEITLELDSSRAVERAGDELGWGTLRYGKLVVTDADGRVLPARMQARDSGILIAFEDHAARYPVTVDPLVWVEQKVAASDGAAGNEFGYSVALDGSTAVIGADKASVGGSVQGAAYVFTRSGTAWSEVARLTADDGAAGDAFGYSVSLSGNRAVVGARARDANQGAVYVFEGSGASWTQTARLVTDDAAPDARFGTIVSVAGDRVFATAATADVGPNAMQGAAYIFERSGGSWSQVAKLAASDGAGNDQGGISGAFDGTTAVLGTPNPGFFAGAAYVFVESGGSWTQAAKLTAPGAGPFTAFGSALAVQGDTILVGGNLAFGSAPSSGAAWVFTRSGGNWTLQQQLFADDGEPGADFGYAVALDGTTAVVGADRAGGEQGAVYLFEQSGGTWSQTGKLTASDASAGGVYGNAVAKQGDTLLIGASGSGAAYFNTATTAGADPVAEVTPAALDFTVVAGASSTQALTIANQGGSTLTYAITPATASGAMPTSYKTQAARRATSGASRANLQLRSARRAGLPGLLGEPLPPDHYAISQMADNTPGNEGVSCSDDFSTAANSWWRRFYFSEHPQVGAHAAIQSVTVSSGSNVIPGGLPATINLYTLPHGTPADTIPTSALTLIGSGTATISAGLESVTIPVTGLVSDTSDLDLVVEYHTEGSDSGAWFPGANATPESHPSFLMAPECGVDEPVSAAELGFDDFHLTMVVTLGSGEPGPGCEDPGSVPWLQVPVPSGSVAPGQSKSVSIVVDAHGLASGTYAANLCVASNDPLRPIIDVPVSLTVTAADAIFCSGFEEGETGACGPADVVLGHVDEDVNADEDGNTLDLVTGLWSTYDGTRIDDINLYAADDTLTVYFYGDMVALPVGAVVDGSGHVAVLQSGSIVGPGSPISPGSGYLANWLDGTDGYMGIAFRNEQTGEINYGYIHMTTTAPLGFPARVLEYAYDSTGAAIRIP